MSLRKAINDKCRDCAYDPLAEGTWRAQVSDCGGTECPLYRVRPLSKGAKEATPTYPTSQTEIVPVRGQLGTFTGVPQDTTREVQ